MNDNWIEIVETLQPYVKCNSTELKHQQEVENCLKFLGWRSSNKTMQSQLTLGFGAGNTLRPDIILYKNGTPVLPIEIKRPDNVCNDKQVGQLGNYMRQLKSNIGLYFGENIRFYYDNPDDLDNPICVFKVELCRNEPNGEMFCEIMSYEEFDVNKLEKFCEEYYNQIMAHNSLQLRLDEFLSVDKANMNVIALIKDKFVKEGFDRDTVEEELDKLDIQIKQKQHNIINIFDINSIIKPQNKNIEFKDKIKENLRTVGLSSFIHLYPILKNNMDARIEDVVVQIPKFGEYELSSQQTKLSTARSIFKSGWEDNALLIIAESKKVDEDLLQQVKIYISNINHYDDY